MARSACPGTPGSVRSEVIHLPPIPLRVPSPFLEYGQAMQGALLRRDPGEAKLHQAFHVRFTRLETPPSEGRDDMSIKKGAAAVAVGFFVCIAPMGLRSTAVAQHEAGKAKGGADHQGGRDPAADQGEQGGRAVTFLQAEGGIQVKGEVSGLTPGEHGFHVHEFGVWSPDGKAAGGPLQPRKPRRTPSATAAKRHVGDLGNIKANENGNATIDFVDEHLPSTAPTRSSAAASSSTRRPTTSASPSATPAAASPSGSSAWRSRDGSGEWRVVKCHKIRPGRASCSTRLRPGSPRPMPAGGP